MKIHKSILITVLFVIAITLIIWSNKESNNNRALGYYNADLEGFKNIYGEILNSLDILIDSPNIDNYNEVQYQIGKIIGKLGSLDRTMSECYRMGLLQTDKLKYNDSDVTVMIARIFKDSRIEINNSIELKDDKLNVDENRIRLVYEELEIVNDLIKPYYDTIN